VVTASDTDDMEGIGGKMVEILNLLLSLSFRGGWSVERPFWKKIVIMELEILINLEIGYLNKYFLQ